MAYREDIPYSEVQGEQNLMKRKDYWEIGKGLQAVDGLPTSGYLEQVMQDTIAGKYDTETAIKKLKEYYVEINPDSPAFETKEGDEVTARIVAILETYSFTFSPIMLKTIHRGLFEGIETLCEYRPGEFRKVNLTKEEPVLNRESMVYADWRMISEQLNYDFEQEKNVKYNVPFGYEEVKKITKFISGIWETHAFREGNTRTTAVFLILYLRSMGVPTNNDYFKTHSEYFRDALVRSNYNKIAKGIKTDSTYLEKFFENMLLDGTYDLDSLDLRCKELF